MKVIIFDVGNASSALVVSPNGYGMMIDCGCNSEKTNPIETINRNQEWLNLKPFVDSNGNSYPLALLHITHPDDDHVRNAERVKKELNPFSLRRTKGIEFPNSEGIHVDYKKMFDTAYNTYTTETIDWGLDINEIFQIPIEEVKLNPSLNGAINNNSSILRYIKHNGVSILFSGDLEKEGWEWLTENDKNFKEIIQKNGVDILISAHHGHKSGFSTDFFNIAKDVKCVIHSKTKENSQYSSDVSGSYSDRCSGIIYRSLENKKYYNGRVLTTRSNGNIYIYIANSEFIISSSRHSPNHQEKITFR